MERFSKKEHYEKKDDGAGSTDFKIVDDYNHIAQLAAEQVLALLAWLYGRVVALVRLINAPAHQERNTDE
jgi:hypothetical protein